MKKFRSWKNKGVMDRSCSCVWARFRKTSAACSDGKCEHTCVEDLVCKLHLRALSLFSGRQQDIRLEFLAWAVQFLPVMSHSNRQIAASGGWVEVRCWVRWRLRCEYKFAHSWYDLCCVKVMPMIMLPGWACRAIARNRVVVGKEESQNRHIGLALRSGREARQTRDGGG